jgi:hypothetical protein
MHLVLYQLDIDMYQSGEHMVNTEKKRNETWYSKILYNQRNKEETIMSGKSVSLVNTLHQG